MKKPKDKRIADTTTVGEALNQMLNNFHLKERFDEKRLIEAWSTVMGATIANRTTKVFIKNKVLFVEVSSAPLKKELNMSKDKIISLFSKEVGQGIIQEIIIM